MSPEILQKHVSVEKEWVSDYASVTFNSEGMDFPDGGFNEKGLAVFEMSLRNSIFLKDEEKPTLFMCVWMQYLLDTCSNVDEVISTLDTVNLDGWHWHFFVADRSGAYAMIESPNQKLTITRGDRRLYPVLCNSLYSKEMKRLKQYREETGFLDTLIHMIRKTPRFIRAADMLDNRNSKKESFDRDAALKLLDNIAISGWNKWQILIDINTLTVYYHTNRNTDLRYVSLRDVDIDSMALSKMLDIHGDGEGNVSGQFKDYSKELNTTFVKERADILFEKRLKPLEHNGVTADIYASRFISYSENIRNNKLVFFNSD